MVLYTIIRNTTIEENKATFRKTNCINEVDIYEFLPLILATYLPNFEVYMFNHNC